MNLKYIVTVILIMLSISIINAQKIKIKKGVIFIDDVKCLSTDGDPVNISFYDIDGEEFIFMKYLDDRRDGENYMKITFLDQKLSLTSKSFIFTKKMLIKRLLSSKTIENCKLNPDKVERFILKYDEDVEREDINVNINIDRN